VDIMHKRGRGSSIRYKQRKHFLQRAVNRLEISSTAANILYKKLNAVGACPEIFGAKIVSYNRQRGNNRVLYEVFLEGEIIRFVYDLRQRNTISIWRLTSWNRPKVDVTNPLTNMV